MAARNPMPSWPPDYFPPLPEIQNAPTPAGVRLGRLLFYDPILSRDSSISCASCHKQAHAFADTKLRFSLGIDSQRTARNTPPLFNLAWYEAMFWDGRAPTIEAQVFHPVRDATEMDLDWNEAVKRLERSALYQPRFEAIYGPGPIDSTMVSEVIAQFERTLISNNSKYDSVLRGEAYFTAMEFGGFVIVNDQSMGDCLHCHTTDATALGTSGSFSNNGLSGAQAYDEFHDLGLAAITGDSSDAGRFKIPSLRNVAVTAPYMHDGRFATLEDVLSFYTEGVQTGFNVDPKMTRAHVGGVHLSRAQKDSVLAFLETLTDFHFLTDTSLSNPHGR